MRHPFSDETIDFMRADLESDFAYTKLIDAAKKMFKNQGRDFEAEFAEWERKKKEEQTRKNNQLLVKEMQGGKE